jgi:hypothetical protein
MERVVDRMGGPRLAVIILMTAVACGPRGGTADGGENGSASGGSSTGEEPHPLGWSCGDGVPVKGEYCFVEYFLDDIDVLAIGLGDFTGDGRADIVVQTPDELRSYAVHDDGTFELLHAWGGPPHPQSASNVQLWVADVTANGRGDVIRTSAFAIYELDLFLQEADGSMTHVRRDFPESGVIPDGEMLVPSGILDVMADGRPAVLAAGIFPGEPAFAAWRYVDEHWQQIGDPFVFYSGGVLTAVRTADLDGDGLTDVSAHLEPEGVREKRQSDRWPEWFDERAVHFGATKPDGSGLTAAITLSPGFHPSFHGGIRVGDIDGNGFPDIVLSGREDDVYEGDLFEEGSFERGAARRVVYWGRGDWVFDGPHAFDHSGTIQDYDGDGMADIARERSVWAYDGGEIVRMAEDVPILPGSNPADINADGILDGARWVAPPMGQPRERGRLRVVLSDP